MVNLMINYSYIDYVRILFMTELQTEQAIDTVKNGDGRLIGLGDINDSVGKRKNSAEVIGINGGEITMEHVF